MELSTEELSKISAFVNSCDDMINGKFILADIKILKILNMIANSEPLSRYIQECMIDFDFNREFSRAEVKNRFNNGHFTIPTEPSKLVAMVFSLLVEFDKKHIDFYSFINNNFATLTKGGEYENFAKTLLVPFRDIIAYNFGLIDSAMAVMPEDEQDTQDEAQPSQMQPEIDKAVIEEEQTEEDHIWKNIGFLVENISNTIVMERRIKNDDKDNILYMLKSITYSTKYKDMRLVSSLLMAVEMVTKKIRTITIMMDEIKNEIKHYYDYKLKQSNQD